MPAKAAVKVTVVEASQWQPTAEEFSCALSGLNERDAVRRAIEDAQDELQSDDFPHHRSVVKSRLLARHLLLHMLCNERKHALSNPIEKSQVLLTCTTYGKPVTSLYQRGDFSVSHGPRWICCAHSPCSAVGVDVTAVEPIDSALLLLILSDREAEQAREKPPAELPQFFAVYWSVKEAILKALGLGLSPLLQMKDVCLRFDDERSPLEALKLEPGRANLSHRKLMTVSLRASEEARWTYSLLHIPGEPAHVFALTSPSDESLDSIEWYIETVESVLHS